MKELNQLLNSNLMLIRKIVSITMKKENLKYDFLLF